MLLHYNVYRALIILQEALRTVTIHGNPQITSPKFGLTNERRMDDWSEDKNAQELKLLAVLSQRPKCADCHEHFYNEAQLYWHREMWCVDSWKVLLFVAN